jgi:hypothetical protein
MIFLISQYKYKWLFIVIKINWEIRTLTLHSADEVYGQIKLCLYRLNLLDGPNHYGSFKPSTLIFFSCVSYTYSISKDISHNCMLGFVGINSDILYCHFATKNRRESDCCEF